MIGIAGATPNASRYQIKILLRGSKPVIWRRVLVSSTIPLDRLHMVIQTVMGWLNKHPHHFQAHGIRYGEPNLQLGMLDESNHRLRDIAIGKTFIYEYDAGFALVHEVLVENIFSSSSLFKHPLCLGGENACPPEDSGRIPGHLKLVAVISDPMCESYAEIIERVAGTANAGSFDLERVNSLLERIKA